MLAAAVVESAIFRTVASACICAYDVASPSSTSFPLAFFLILRDFDASSDTFDASKNQPWRVSCSPELTISQRVFGCEHLCLSVVDGGCSFGYSPVHGVQEDSISTASSAKNNSKSSSPINLNLKILSSLNLLRFVDSNGGAVGGHGGSSGNDSFPNEA
nr:hypothetical protein Iba_chr05aCG8350 [Ipomoea batatas]